MKKYTYINKKTGAKVTSDIPLDKKDFVIVSEVRNGMIKSEKVKQK